VDVNTIRPVTQRLTDGQQVGVVVLINKYDGMDLPDDACRLLIVASRTSNGTPTPSDRGPAGPSADVP
jgi:hypothetical protein